jgi:hypothetical protein
LSRPLAPLPSAEGVPARAALGSPGGPPRGRHHDRSGFPNGGRASTLYPGKKVHDRTGGQPQHARADEYQHDDDYRRWFAHPGRGVLVVLWIAVLVAA